MHLSRVFVWCCVINKYVVFNLMAARGRTTIQSDYTGSAVVHEGVAADLQAIRESIFLGYRHHIATVHNHTPFER